MPSIPPSISARAAAWSFRARACEAQRPGAHHRDVRAVLVELDLVALTGRVLDHEGEEPEVPLGVAGHQVVALEVEGGEVAVIILHPLAHQRRAGPGVEREVLARRLGGAARAS